MDKNYVICGASNIKNNDVLNELIKKCDYEYDVDVHDLDEESLAMLVESLNTIPFLTSHKIVVCKFCCRHRCQHHRNPHHQRVDMEQEAADPHKRRDQDQAHGGIVAAERRDHRLHICLRQNGSDENHGDCRVCLV